MTPSRHPHPILAAATLLTLLGLLLPVAALAQAAAAEEPEKPAAPYDLSRMEAFSWTLLQLKQDYVDPSRVDPARMLKKALEYIERRVNEVEIHRHNGTVEVQVGPKKANFEVGNVGTVWEMNYALQPVMKFIAANLESTTDAKDVEFAAINGALSTLDPHSNLLPPELFREMQLKTTGEFGGLGIRIAIRKGALTIIAPLPDTPASRLGLKALDQIVRIGDVSTVNMPLDEAVNLLRGKSGSKVTIWVMRKGWSEPHKYVMTRETIRVRSILSKLLPERVGYIQIQDFSRHTGGDLLRHLSQLKREAKGLTGLILDLRNNAGGLMKAAVQVADLFLDRGVIVATVSYSEDSTPEQRVQKSREEQRAEEDGTEADLPIVVLVNSGAASASEILAGALKNLDRAILMGEQTFGKGTVQILNERVPPSVEGACLKLTVAEYLIPGDVSIQEIGVTPDIELLPVVLDPEDVQLFAQPQRFREEDIPAHLKKKNRDRVELKPAEVVRFLDEEALKAKKELEDNEEPPIEEEGYKEDFAIRLARDLLLRVKTPRGSAMLDEAAGFLREVEKAQGDKIAAAVHGLSVDWSAPPAAEARPVCQLESSFSLEGEGLDAEGRAKADSKIKLKLGVHNAGSAPCYRLRAESRCKHALFDRREFLFGRLDPGQSRNWLVPVKVPRGVSTRTDDLRFLFDCEQCQAPERLETRVSTAGLPRPAFGFSWRVLEIEGQADGLLQPGEKVRLELSVHNHGAGKAPDAKALLVNEAGRDLFLEPGGGRLQFGEIGPGETKREAFRFSVRADTSRTELPVEVTIWDAALGVTQVAKMNLPLYAPPAAPPAETHATLEVIRSRAEVRGGADPGAPLLAFARKGTRLAADRKSGRWYRLQAPGGSPGWILADAVRLLPGSKAAPAPDGLLPFEQYTPPRIELEDVPTYLSQGESITLRGRVVDEDADLRDVAVWVGTDKVSLQSGSEARDARSLPLEVTVPLDPGPNVISIVAREGSRYAGQKTLLVTRPGGLDWKRPDAEEEDGEVLDLLQQ